MLLSACTALVTNMHASPQTPAVNATDGPFYGGATVSECGQKHAQRGQRGQRGWRDQASNQGRADGTPPKSAKVQTKLSPFEANMHLNCSQVADTRASQRVPCPCLWHIAMEPLAALGLAGNIVQFVHFASGLIETAAEIRRSSTGCTADVLTRDKVYRQLEDFDVKLAPTCGNAVVGPAQGAGSAKPVTPLQELSRVCKSDCKRLLQVVDKLRVQFGSAGRWQCFRAALKAVWKKGEIEALEQRLTRTQVTMTLHVCNIVGQAQEMHEEHLRQLRTESKKLQSNQSVMLDQINVAIDHLTQLIDQVQHNNEHCLPSAEELQRLGQQISKVALSQGAAAEQQAIIKSLGFQSREVRHTMIPKALQETYEWVYELEAAASPTSARYVAQWLRSDDDIFWVSGKPGFGKSTFVKFVAGDSRTRTLLSKWSSPKRLVVAGHYFWSAGTIMQKSEQGLLRTLLYEIFRQCPELIKPACEDRWVGPSQAGGEEFSNWTVPILRATLRKVAAHASSTRFCFFIDGLDEFDGQHDELCQVLKDLAKSADIKLCISSRPWNVFEEAFGNQTQRKLYMKDLTRDDILKYIRSRLYEHPRWSALTATSSGDWLWLVEEIEKRACGVFLWVVLVIKLLQEGLTNRDCFSDIHRRLESFPLELEPFFRQILESVQPFYHNKMSTTLQMAVAAEVPLPAMPYAFHDEGYDDENYIFEVPTEPYTAKEYRELKEEMMWRLNSRTRGLLELDPVSGFVTVLHRTVMDFLTTREMSDFLVEKAPAEFNLPLTLLRVYTATIKRGCFPQKHDFELRHAGPYDLETLTANTLACAAEVEKSISSRIVAYSIIEELDRIMPKVFPWPTDPTSNAFLRDRSINAEFVGYLAWKLPQDSRYFSGMGSPLIFRILCPSSSGYVAEEFSLTGRWRASGIEMLPLVLQTQNLEPDAIRESQGSARSESPWAFQIPADTVREDLYLRTLCDFIDAGAAVRGGQIDEMTYQPDSLPLRKMFFSRLRFLVHERSPSDNIRLLADVVDVLLATIDGTGPIWLTPMDRKIVEEVFPDGILEGLRERHPIIPWGDSRYQRFTATHGRLDRLGQDV